MSIKWAIITKTLHEGLYEIWELRKREFGRELGEAWESRELVAMSLYGHESKAMSVYIVLYLSLHIKNMREPWVPWVFV